MKLKLSVNRHTTASELIILGALFESLALAREGHVSSVSVDVEPGDDPTSADTFVVQAASAGEEAPKRKRRTRAEMEAANLPKAPEEVPAGNVDVGTSTEDAVTSEPASASATGGKAGNENPAATPAVQPQATPPSETASSEPASASPSERPAPTPASLNMKATAIAKKIGPEKIKAKISELGGKLISTLSPEALIEFDAWLDAQ